jgi:hypothetical protein
MSTNLKNLIEAARNIEMTPEMVRQQRRSFAFGNVHIHNPDVTRKMVAQVDEAMEEQETGRQFGN